MHRPPLAENPAHAEDLCARLALGRPVGGLSRVYGGLHHRMWRLTTDRGRYAIKQLAEDPDPAEADTARHYNATEATAQTFAACGIPAIVALGDRDNYLQLIAGAGYLVYPWTDAAALDKHRIDAIHVREVARLLANMHRANIVVPRLGDAKFEYQPQEKILALVERALACNLLHAGVLSEQLPAFLRMADAHREAIPILEEKLVISHGDVDHKNVLWDTGGGPLLIDWESARRLNATYEILMEALDWSGITVTFRQDLFRTMLAAYIEAGGVIDGDSIEASFHCILGDWLNWLLFNVGRGNDRADAEEHATGAGQVDLALAAIMRLERLLPGLLAAAKQASAEQAAGHACLT